MAAEMHSERVSFLFDEDIAGPARSLATLRMALAAVEEFTQARSPDDRLIRLQYISQFTSYLPDEVLRSLAAEALQDEDPRIRGEMCYALGRSGRSSFIPELQLLKDDPAHWVQRHAKEALQVLEKATPTVSDFQHLQHQVERLLKEVKAEGGLVSREVTKALTQLSRAEPGDIQGIAASQIRLLTSYYNAVLAQATMSFRWALVAAGIGLVFFLGAIAFLLSAGTKDLATIGVAAIGAIGGAIVEVISGINFFLYGRATSQLAHFHQRLDQTQRFLLANSICESLENKAKQKSRAELITVIATLGLKQTGLSDADAE